MRLAVIPARGGSKRIPRKNIKPFFGKPIIAWSIETALESGCFDQVIVSTDDAEIARIALGFGATAPFMRPVAIADDFATTKEVVIHAIDTCLQNDMDIAEVCCIYATAPMLLPADLLAARDMLKEHRPEFVLAVTEFSYPIQRALMMSETGSLRMVQPDEETTRSQDLTKTWHDAGMFYWGNTEAWLKDKGLFSSNSMGSKIERSRVVDIDTPEDWQLAEDMFRLFKNR